MKIVKSGVVNLNCQFKSKTDENVNETNLSENSVLKPF